MPCSACRSGPHPGRSARGPARVMRGRRSWRGLEDDLVARHATVSAGWRSGSKLRTSVRPITCQPVGMALEVMAVCPAANSTLPAGTDWRTWRAAECGVPGVKAAIDEAGGKAGGQHPQRRGVVGGDKLTHTEPQVRATWSRSGPASPPKVTPNLCLVTTLISGAFVSESRSRSSPDMPDELLWCGS